MCSECEHVSCLVCQKTYYSKPANAACSICRQESKEKFKPLNKKLRKKMSRLKFECTDCKAILVVSDQGNGQGRHTDSCKVEVRYKCSCGHTFSANFKEIKSLLKLHLISECHQILCQNTRRLMRVVNRFEELGVPESLIDYYKK